MKKSRTKKDEESSPIFELCSELGLDPNREFNRLRDSVFSYFIKGERSENAQIDNDVVRMWIASMVARDEVKPEMRSVYDQLKQIGTYELREAWEVSELTPDSFNETVLYGRSNTPFESGARVLH